MESTEQMRIVYERYQRAWVERRWDDLAATLHEGYAFSVGGRRVGDVASMLAWSRRLLDAVPDYGHDVVAVHASPAVLVVEAVATGTTSGLPLGPDGPTPRPGRSLRLPYAKVLGFDGGRIRDDRQYHDGAALLAQLFPTPPAAPRS